MSATVILGLAVVAAGLLVAVVRYATFPSPPAAAQHIEALREASGEEIWLDSNSDRIEAWLLPARSSGPTPLLMYAHGNGELIDMQTEQMQSLRDAGVAVLLVEYPGYGRSEGRPTEQSVTNAMVAAYDWASKDARFNATQIVGFGRSLGGGAMSQLAARRPLAALVLSSTFTSVTDIVRTHGVPDWFVWNRFDSRAALPQYAGPLLILHGSRDVNIPVAHALALHVAVPRATLSLSECGHNDCPPQWELVLSFLARNGVFSKSVSGDSP